MGAIYKAPEIAENECTISRLYRLLSGHGDYYSFFYFFSCFSVANHRLYMHSTQLWYAVAPSKYR